MRPIGSILVIVALAGCPRTPSHPTEQATCLDGGGSPAGQPCAGGSDYFGPTCCEDGYCRFYCTCPRFGRWLCCASPYYMPDPMCVGGPDLAVADLSTEGSFDLAVPDLERPRDMRSGD